MSAATPATLRAAARSARSHLEAPTLAELLEAAAVPTDAQGQTELALEKA